MRCGGRVAGTTRRGSGEVQRTRWQANPHHGPGVRQHTAGRRLAVRGWTGNGHPHPWEIGRIEPTWVADSFGDSVADIQLGECNNVGKHCGCAAGPGELADLSVAFSTASSLSLLLTPPLLFLLALTPLPPVTCRALQRRYREWGALGCSLTIFPALGGSRVTVVHAAGAAPCATHCILLRRCRARPSRAYVCSGCPRHLFCARRHHSGERC